MTEYNSLGYEVWYSTHIGDEIRPELKGLPPGERAKMIVDHWPDLTEEQLAKLAALLRG